MVKGVGRPTNKEINAACARLFATISREAWRARMVESANLIALALDADVVTRELLELEGLLAVARDRAPVWAEELRANDAAERLENPTPEAPPTSPRPFFPPRPPLRFKG